MEQQTSAGDFKKNVLLLKPGDVTKRDDRVLTPTLNTLSQLRKTEQFKRDVVFSRNMSAVDVRKKLVEAFPALENKRYIFLIVMLMQLILHSQQILNTWLLCNHTFSTYESWAIGSKYFRTFSLYISSLYLLIIKLKSRLVQNNSKLFSWWYKRCSLMIVDYKISA